MCCACNRVKACHGKLKKKNWGISLRHGQEKLLCLCNVLCSSVAAENLLRTSRSPTSVDCSGSGSVPKCLRLDSVLLHYRTGWWLGLCQPSGGMRTRTQDSAWLTETPKARVFIRQDYFSPVWLSLHCMIRWLSLIVKLSVSLSHRDRPVEEMTCSVKGQKLAANPIPVICDHWIEFSDSFSILIFAFLGCEQTTIIMVKMIINLLFGLLIWTGYLTDTSLQLNTCNVYSVTVKYITANCKCKTIL